MWKLIGRSLTYPNNELLEFCVNKIERIAGMNVVAYAGTEDSERIYFEETGEEMRSGMSLIRVTFTIATIISWCPKTVELCMNREC